MRCDERGCGGAATSNPGRKGRVTLARALPLAGAMLWVACAAGAAADDVPYGVAEKPWPDALGNHRARVQVTGPADAVGVHLPWRRRDREPQGKHLLITDAATGREVKNVARVQVGRESGDLVFQPATAPGEYYIYYLPFKVQPGVGSYRGDYLPPTSEADAAWLGRQGLAPPATAAWRALPQAKVLEFQARTAFDRFDPMEVPATADEMEKFRAAHRGSAWLLFPEDRRFPIRMTDELPRRWIERGPDAEFRGEAQRNEYYAFQVGVYAAGAAAEDLAVAFADLAGPGGVIPASALRCFNLGGTDWLGRPFRKTVSVPQGVVQALWFGVDVPRDAAPGAYRGTLALRAKGVAPTPVKVALTVLDTVVEDRGDSEPWRHSRLRWLDSTLAMDDEPVAPYPALALEGRTIRCLGREVRLAAGGLPESIRSGGEEILARPVALVLAGAEGAARAGAAGDLEFVKQARGAVAWESAGGGPVARRTQGRMEFDGHLHYDITLTAARPVDLADLRLEIPLRPQVAAYLMGFGRKGGLRPRETWTWMWSGGPGYYDSGWLGDVRAGLQLELRGTTYSGPMVNLYRRLGQLQPPPAWANDGRGGITVTEEPDGGPVVLRAFTGPRRLEPGQPVALEFALLVTPVRPLDTAAHFRERYYHADAEVRTVVAAGANLINIHHATPLNPYINYPFVATERLAAYTREAHAAGAKVKIYYTVRELTNHVTEMAALRSLGHEVLAPGRGGGYPWLREHLVSDYAPAWYHRFADGDVCAAVVTAGESRWYNYYVEGLAWVLASAGIDGLYLDDVTYDRETLKRMRKVMERLRPGCRIDLHSQRDFSRGPANQYMEFFPYVDRLWFGEAFNYDDPPDYWLVEISGIPFGLMGEMLQGGGNRWRGMLYGMTARMPSSRDPAHLWKLWDDFRIAEARMIGYWDAACPVRTGRPDVLATAYVRPGRTLISLASWAPEPVRVALAIDWKALGLDGAKAVLRAPAVEGFQPAAEFKPADEIPVQPARGWLLLVP